jgi:hypothetical protein
MKTKIKLSIFILFFALTSKGQINWAKQMVATSNDTLITASAIVFDSLNHPYVIGFLNNSNVQDLLHFNGSSWNSYGANTVVGNMVFDKNDLLWLTMNSNILGYIDSINN